ncbi:MAG: CTP synthase [Solirubrobacteraceae bacterium]|nr:CTP synthase [Solirubrobacteraceae bacterium]
MTPSAQPQRKTKFIFITGGVVSSLGKGIAAASIGRLLVARGLTVGLQKFDPYINVDPGTMSPYQHGEVFVTEDGAETDLDLGHYERYTDANTSRASNVTAGGIYNSVIRRERRGDYLGGTVQVVPHITDEIKHRVQLLAQMHDVDIIITEIGGTVGDIESLPFLEAIRQFPVDVGRRECMFIHLTLVPYIGHAGELKTKPTQHSVNELRRIGIQPDMLLCRSESELGQDIRKKIALFASLPVEAVISAKDVDNIYKVPLWFADEGVDDLICDHFSIDAPPPDLSEWNEITRRASAATETVRISLVGKYVALQDAYLSVAEALRHSGFHHDCNVEIDWVDSELLTSDAAALERLGGADGILIPGGFGGRGIEGKIRAARVAREQRIPYLGVCLGMQVAVMEFARHVAGMEGANSTEFDPETPYPVIDLLPEQKEITDLGGTMRLGVEPIKIHPGTRARALYGELAYERHRHRYEVNIFLRKRLEAAGLIVGATTTDERLVEMIELDDHPFFVASQFHPEFKSRPERPAPLFRDFVGAALQRGRRDEQPVGAPDELRISRG